MLSKAEGKFFRGSGKKVRQVVDLIRGMGAEEALGFLKFVDKRPAGMIAKVLKSAIANAKVKGLDGGNLFISKITADDGPRWKRYNSQAFGRAAEILKRTSHIRVELDLRGKK